MQSLFAKLLAMAACAALATASKLPATDNHLLAARDFKQCPAIDNTIFTSASGRSKWRLLCNRGTVGDGKHAVERHSTDGFEVCIKICGDSSHVGWCHYAIFDGSDVSNGGTCYLKDEEAGPVGRTNGMPGWKVAVKQ